VRTQAASQRLALPQFPAPAPPALCGVIGTTSNPKLVTIDTQCYGREVASEAKAPTRNAADLLSPLRSLRLLR
jgi:hypothetical protein